MATAISASDFYSIVALMPDGQLKKVNLDDYIGSYVLLIFYPGDFNPLAKVELTDFSKQHEKFANNGCQV
jgi:alkyl hydroperoxide reductase subunit AhpC